MPSTQLDKIAAKSSLALSAELVLILFLKTTRWTSSASIPQAPNRGFLTWPRVRTNTLKPLTAMRRRRKSEEKSHGRQEFRLAAVSKRDAMTLTTVVAVRPPDDGLEEVVATF